MHGITRLFRHRRGEHRAVERRNLCFTVRFQDLIELRQIKIDKAGAVREAVMGGGIEPADIRIRSSLLPSQPE